jgi:hypothetical protein
MAASSAAMTMKAAAELNGPARRPQGAKARVRRPGPRIGRNPFTATRPAKKPAKNQLRGNQRAESVGQACPTEAVVAAFWPWFIRIPAIVDQRP